MVAEDWGNGGPGGPTFDVFFSHSARDKGEVGELAAALRARGLRPWLDVEQLVPGAPFQPGIMAGLSGSRCFAVFVGAEQVGTWVREELDVAVARAAGDRSFRVFLVLLPTAPAHFDPTGLHQFLSQRTWVDLRRVRQPDLAADLLARAVRGEPLGFVDHKVADAGAICPYVGLRPFDVDDARWFFGRDADIQRMGEKLRHSPFLAVLGRSGSGKSSVVRAGLVAALQAGRLIPGSERWTIRVLRPTATPLEALAAQLSTLRPDLPGARVLDDLVGSDVALKILLAGCGEPEPVMFVIDQAEELYTLCASPRHRRAFTANLMHASQPGGPAGVVLTLRSDFYARFMELEAFSARIASNQHVVTDLGDQELEQVIHQPATLAGLTLQAGLVERMMGDVRAQAGALPLLQHALRELWERRHHDELTHDSYTRIGGVEGALAQRADRVFAEMARHGDGPVVRRLMLELTRLAEGSEDTKQPVVLSQLEAPAFPLERLHRVTAALADARLVTTGDPSGRGHQQPSPAPSCGDSGGDSWRERPGGCDGHDPGTRQAPAGVRVELAHEALIRSWPRLRSWIEESRDDIRARRRIRDAAQAWDDQGRPDGLLYRDTPLALARARLRNQPGEMTRLETEFLQASIRREDADRARTRRTRRITLTGVLAALVVIATITTSLSVVARRAQQRAEDNAARALAQQAQALAPQQPALAIAVAAEALARNDDPEIAHALQVAHLAYGRAPGRFRRVLTGHDAPVTSAAFSPDGNLLATASTDGVVKLWNPHTGENVLSFVDPGGLVRNIAFSPNGTQIATASDDAAARLWDPRMGRLLHTLVGHPNHVFDVAFNRDGSRVATAGGDGRVRVWDTLTGGLVQNFHADTGSVLSVAFDPLHPLIATSSTNGMAKVWPADTNDDRDDEPLMTFTGHTGSVHDVDFSPDGRELATAGADRTVRLWDVGSGDESRTLTGYRAEVTSVAFNPDGDLVATASDDATARLWDLNTGGETTLNGHASSVLGVAFSPDGTMLATASDDRTIKVWDTRIDNEITTLARHADIVLDVTFESEGDRIATASRDGTAVLWGPDAHAGVTTAISRLDHAVDASVFGVAFSPNRQWVATAGSDGTIRIWDAETGHPVRDLTSDGDGVRDVAFSPGGTLIASGSDGRTARLWDLGTGEVAHALIGHEGTVTGVAFSPNGARVATSSRDGTARVWDVTSGHEIGGFVGDANPVLGVAFSPDGSLLATAHLDGTARIWDVGSGNEVVTLDGHEAGVRDVDFSPDGRMLATGSDDGTARIWDVESGDEITTLGGHDGAVLGVAFSPDGTRLATASDDRTAMIRHLVLTSEDACALVAGEVTQRDLQDALGQMTPRACTA